MASYLACKALRSARAWLLPLLALVLVACAQGRSDRLRDGAPEDEDGGGVPRDGGVALDVGMPADAGSMMMADARVPATDAWVMPGVDAATPPSDAGRPVGTRRYLDRCTGAGDCASSLCEDDLGSTRFCSRTCTSDLECANEHVCVSGRCQADDTGEPCSTASGASCTTGLCVGNAMAGTGKCTRLCGSAADCPAGYACADAGGTRVCVDIEHSCASATACATGLCLSAQGCTAECRSAADCPRRLAGLPPYTCAIAFGSANPICVPPTDIQGPDPIGAICPAVGTNRCRSGACDTSAPLGPMCTQECTERGGCALGLGCFPQIDGSDLYLVCARAGARDLGESCATGRECQSGLCDTAGYCTRLCGDGLCPSDMSCSPVAGFGIALCRR